MTANYREFVKTALIFNTRLSNLQKNNPGLLSELCTLADTLAIMLAEDRQADKMILIDVTEEFYSWVADLLAYFDKFALEHQHLLPDECQDLEWVDKACLRPIYSNRVAFR